MNRDGKVNAKDARLALRISAKLESTDEYGQKIADVNKDGKLNSKDARTILRMAAKLEPLVEEKVSVPKAPAE
ncbi:MAG: dockerin type I repeat-containing protein [Clostridia bacterium]|nr:dockerin type I repeat-containing protein [Clostridia bacterium]